jgi:hypothetical protein
MTVQAALLFLRDARDDGDLRAELARRRFTLDPQALVVLGAARGWSFSEDELRSAFRVDWQLRVARSSGASIRPESR